MEFLVGLIFLYSIYNYQDTQSSVILLENEDLKNEVIVSTDKDKLSLSEANTYVSLDKGSKTLQIKEIKEEDLEKKYGNILAKKTPDPVSLLFYFTSGTVLDENSKQKLDLIKKEIEKRQPASVTIIGHSDTLGTEKANVKLSLKRAKSIKQWMLNNNISSRELLVESYGENDLLVWTEDEVKEPLNRRVEVLIR